jgi:hypothetical protein
MRGEDAIAMIGIVPGAVDSDRDDQGDQHDPAVGPAAFGRRRRKHEPRIFWRRAFVLDGLEQGIGVEPEVLGIIFEKAGRVNAARQILETPFFQRDQVRKANIQLAHHVIEIKADLEPPRTQLFADPEVNRRLFLIDDRLDPAMSMFIFPPQ